VSQAEWVFDASFPKAQGLPIPTSGSMLTMPCIMDLDPRSRELPWIATHAAVYHQKRELSHSASRTWTAALQRPCTPLSHTSGKLLRITIPGRNFARPRL